MKRTDLAILMSTVALVTGLAGFGIGRATAGKAQVAGPGISGADGQSGFGGARGSRSGGRPTFGTVSSLSGSTLVVTDSAGTAKNVTLTATTTYTSGDGSTTATQADLTAGTSVAAFGTAATDGTVTATRIIINPSAPGGGAAPPAGSSQAN